MKPLTPSQWITLRLAFSVGEPFETWALVEALRKHPELASWHYKTIATHLDALVEKGYLHRDPGAGGFEGKRHLYSLARPKAEIAAAHIDRFLEHLGDDPELIELVEHQARRRRARAQKPRKRR